MASKQLRMCCSEAAARLASWCTRFDPPTHLQTCAAAGTKMDEPLGWTHTDLDGALFGAPQAARLMSLLLHACICQVACLAATLPQLQGAWVCATCSCCNSGPSACLPCSAL